VVGKGEVSVENNNFKIVNWKGLRHVRTEIGWIKVKI